MTLIPWGLLVAGLVMAARGLWGRLVSVHLHCRACGFDLITLPQPFGLCPECGVNLRRRGSVQQGWWRRWNAVFYPGVALMALGAGVIAVQMADINWAHHRPLAWVRRDIRTAPPEEAGRAIQEVARREEIGKLSPREFQAVFDELLARAENAQPQVIPGIKDILWGYANAGPVDLTRPEGFLGRWRGPSPLARLKQAQITRLAAVLFGLEVEAPLSVYPGQTITIDYTASIGPYTPDPDYYDISVWILQLTLDGEDLPIIESDELPISLQPKVSESGQSQSQVQLPPDLSIGPHELMIRCTIGGSDQPLAIRRNRPALPHIQAVITRPIQIQVPDPGLIYGEP